MRLNLPVVPISVSLVVYFVIIWTKMTSQEETKKSRLLLISHWTKQPKHVDSHEHGLLTFYLRVRIWPDISVT